MADALWHIQETVIGSMGRGGVSVLLAKFWVYNHIFLKEGKENMRIGKEQRKSSCSMPGVTKGWPQYPLTASRGQLGQQSRSRGTSALQGGNSVDEDSISKVRSSTGSKSRKKRRQLLTDSRTTQISRGWEMRQWKNWEPRDDRPGRAWGSGWRARSIARYCAHNRARGNQPRKCLQVATGFQQRSPRLLSLHFASYGSSAYYSNQRTAARTELQGMQWCKRWNSELVGKWKPGFG